MKQSPYERLVVGTNPNASNSRYVRREVINPLMAEAKLDVLLDNTLDTEAAVIDMYRNVLRSGDRLLLPGGDGTYHRSVNALRYLDNDVRESLQLGFLAFGNRCDTARVAGRHRRDALAMADERRGLITYTPLRVTTEGEALDTVTNKLALGYVTIGKALAQGAATFNTAPNRYVLNATRAKLSWSARIALQYYANRVGRFEPLPEGTLVNGEEIDDSVTDIVALNGPSMATVIPNPYKSYESSEFHWGILQGNSRLHLAQLGLRRVIRGDVYSNSTKEITLQFPEKGHTPYQADGEQYIIPLVEQITIDKADESFTVVTS